jgi:nucleoside 2-deoxyribosyltransferase
VRKRLYFAAPLFSDAERSFNLRTAKSLEISFDVFLPQVHGGLLLDLINEGRSEDEARRIVFEADLRAIHNCQIILVVLDGRSIDEGTCFELGVAYALRKQCIGLQTDIRRLLPIGNNPMIDAALEQTFPSVEMLLAWAALQADSLPDGKRAPRSSSH